MRVTNSMIAGRVTYNAQNSLTRFLNLQTQMSTGKKINKPSDDPLGITRDLNYRNELANNMQYQENINQANSWYLKNDEIIASFHDIVSEAKQDAINGADDSFNADARKAFATGLRSSIDKILQLGNSQLEGRHIYSGYKTDTPALQRYANGVAFNGDTGSIRYQIDSFSDVSVNMNGADLFLKPILTLGEGFDLDASLTGSTNLSELHNGAGISQTPGLIEITDKNLGINVSIDISAETTVDDMLTKINNDLLANGITDITARIADDNNSILFETTASGQISGVTPIDNLNSGAGVDVKNGIMHITDNASIDFNIDLKNASTIDDIMNQFNTQMVSAGINNVTMTINTAGTGLEINDTNAVPLNLKIEDLNSNATVVEQLGIAGNINPTLIGTDLAPQSHFSIDELGGTTASDLGILGEFHGNYIGSNLDVQLLSTTNLADLNNGVGLSTGEIVMWQGGNSVTIDLDNPALVTVQDLLDLFNNSGLDITASINADTRGIQVVNNDTNTSFTIEDVSGGSAAKDLGIFGSSDIVGSFYVLANVMESSDDNVPDTVGKLLANFDLGIDLVLNNRAVNGAKGVRLESTMSRLYSQEFMYTERLSELEDADLTKLITDLSIYENNYQAALMASAKIIQPSLMDFLR